MRLTQLFQISVWSMLIRKVVTLSLRSLQLLHHDPCHLNFHGIIYIMIAPCDQIDHSVFTWWRINGFYVLMSKSPIRFQIYSLHKLNKSLGKTQDLSFLIITISPQNPHCQFWCIPEDQSTHFLKMHVSSIYSFHVKRFFTWF